MGFLSRIWGRDKSNADLEYKRSMAHSIVATDVNKLPQSEMEAAWEYGTNRNMIEDERVFDLLRHMSASQRQVIDAKGNLVTNPDGTPQMDDPEFDLNMLAMYVMTTKLIRTSYQDDIDVQIMQAEAQVFMDRIELELNEDEYELGGTNLMEAVKQVIFANIACSKNGRMAKLLKVTGKSYEVRTPTEGKKKNQGEGSNLL